MFQRYPAHRDKMTVKKAASSSPSSPSAGHDSVSLREIRPAGLLSFGPNTEPLELRPLNLLIGPNGCGKSNLLEAIAAARATVSDIRAVLRKGGGASEWIWKGSPGGAAAMDMVFSNGEDQPLRHAFRFKVERSHLYWLDERVEYAAPKSGDKEPYFFYRYQSGRPVLNRLKGNIRELHRDHYDLDSSILNQFKDPEEYPELASIISHYEGIRIYRNWTFGEDNPAREAQPSDSRTDYLLEDYSNLNLCLNQMRRKPKVKKEILEKIRDLYPEIDDFDVTIADGRVQLFLTEGDFIIPAPRLSDGTLRYLCLLAILCNPEPPRLICIEEPELGLHPDLLPSIADLLKSASARTQLIVTTHSEILVNCLTSEPESVVVCDKENGCSSMHRLNSYDLEAWLDKYRLGDLWITGKLGGVRW